MSSHQPKTILIVDDDKAGITDSFVEQFNQKGWQAVGAYDGPGAIARFVDTRPDVVILDIGLPGQSGHAVLAELLRIDPEACIIILTGRIQKIEICRDALKAGAWYFLEKPIKFEELFLRVENEVAQFKERVRGMRLSQLLDFTRAMSHSLKNHLDPLRVLSSMLREEDDREKRKQTWQKLDQQCEDFRSALDRLQRFARLESPMAERFSLNALVHRTQAEAVERYQRLRFGNRPVTTLKTEEVEMMGDPVLIAEAFDTLFTNAFEASPELSEITATLRVEKDIATFTVSDRGEGFSPDLLGKIGQGVVSTRGGNGNYGIGLLMAARVARYYRGQLRVSNRDDGPGASVSISLNMNLNLT